MTEEEPAVYTFNIDEMPVTTKILNAHQEGNWMIGVTENGIRFKHHLPPHKMLNKNGKGEWILQDLRGLK
jgi:hypothetical protein